MVSLRRWICRHLHHRWTAQRAVGIDVAGAGTTIVGCRRCQCELLWLDSVTHPRDAGMP